MRVVIVAATVQEDAIKSGMLYNKLQWSENVELVALQCTKKEIIVNGTTDTGNRLFNLVELEDTEVRGSGEEQEEEDECQRHFY